MIRTTLLVASLLMVSGLAQAAVPMQIPLQGTLRDNAGAPVSEGTFEMTFTLYRDAEGTDSAWTTTREVTVQGGLFRAMLGEDTPVDPQLFTAEGSLWLGVAVEAEPELPLRPLASTPYALAAGEAAGLSCSGCVAPEALSEGALETIRTEAVAAGAAAGFAANAGELAYDDAAAALGATTVQTAIEQLKGLIDDSASTGGSGALNEGAGTISRISNQWGLPSYGTAVEYVHLMNPNPPKVLLHLYGGENTGFASSNNLIVSNSYTPNTYSGGANGQAGEDTLTVLNAGAFNQGDHILIHQTIGTNHGQWELNAVQAINSNSLKLAKALTHTYVSDTSGSTNNMQRAQVVIAASYNTFEVVNGGNVYPSSQLPSGSSDDYYGGIVYIRARQMTVKNGGTIHADHYGHPQNGWCSWNCQSPQGDSECGVNTSNTQTNNCSGGGGGASNSSSCSCSNGGGGGGNRTAGGNGVNTGCYSPGQGGNAKGAEGDGKLHFGGAGASGGYPHGGGASGGLVVIGADTFIVESGGRISANGQNGNGGSHGGVGGGAGGTVAIFANNIDTPDDTNSVAASGGSGGSSCGGNGGQGGEGWVLEQPPITGIVNQSYATGVEIWVDGQEITPTVGDPNGKGLPHWNAQDETWGGTGTEAWSSGPLDLTNAADWTLGEHTIEFKETGGAGGDLKAYLYMIQTFTESSPPVNDTCTTPVAIDLSEGPVVLSGTTEDVMGKTKATDANSAECGGAGGADVTYSITLTERSLINVATVSPFPMRMYLREGDCTEGEVVYCADGDFSTTPFEPGTYFLIVDSDEAQAKGDFTLAVSLTSATLPLNDTCDTAIDLIFSGVGIATHTSSTLYSLDQYSAFCGGEGGPDVVYSFEAGTGQGVEVTVASEDFEPVLHVYKGACATPDNLLTCSTAGSISIPAGLGGDYWLVVDSPGEAEWGNYDLTVTKSQ
ncbi:MAG: hypothetical protein ACPGU1_11530 [Myxococcota bacterium]